MLLLLPCSFSCRLPPHHGVSLQGLACIGAARGVLTVILLHLAPGSSRVHGFTRSFCRPRNPRVRFTRVFRVHGTRGSRVHPVFLARLAATWLQRHGTACRGRRSRAGPAGDTPLQAYYYFVAIGQMAAMPLANSALASPCAVPCWPSSLYTVCSSIGRQRSALRKKRWMRCVAYCRGDRQYVPASSPHSSAYPASPCADLHRGTIPRRCSCALVFAPMATSAGVSERP